MFTFLTSCPLSRDPNKYANGSWVPTLGGAYWPIHSHANREYLEIGTTRHQNRSGFKVKECEFWKTYLPMLLKSGAHFSRNNEKFRNRLNIPTAKRTSNSLYIRKKRRQFRTCRIPLISPPQDFTSKYRRKRDTFMFYFFALKMYIFLRFSNLG